MVNSEKETYSRSDVKCSGEKLIRLGETESRTVCAVSYFIFLILILMFNFIFGQSRTYCNCAIWAETQQKGGGQTVGIWDPGLGNHKCEDPEASDCLECCRNCRALVWPGSQECGSERGAAIAQGRGCGWGVQLLPRVGWEPLRGPEQKSAQKLVYTLAASLWRWC